MTPRTRRVVVLAGPSGSGKSHLADQLARELGLPVLRLDDFYRDGDDPGLPRAHGIVDWDDPAAWDADAAVEAAVALCREGWADVPVYDIPTSRATGRTTLSAGASGVVLAEGIFAADVVVRLREAGVLADALALTHRPAVTFVRRLARDLREARKPPLTLVRRGWSLMRAEPQIVARQVALGAVACTKAQARRRVRALAGQTGPATSAA
ncbi:MAG TPA: AAA family ATPase [Actinomycetales bacterium]